MWSFFTRPFRRIRQNQNLHIYALLTAKFNSQIRETQTFQHLLNKNEYRIAIKKPYLPVSEKYGDCERMVGEWPLERVSHNLVVNAIGQTTASSFFYPLDLLELDPKIKHALGEPEYIHKAFLLSSGRSLMVIPPDRDGFVLKVDTSNYSQLKNYSMRLLTEQNINFCAEVSDYCGRFHPIFPEKSGVTVLDKLPVDRTREAGLRTLIRIPFISSMQKDDYLVPVTAFFSEEFWANGDLLKSLGIRTELRSEMFGQLARLMARQIKTSLSESFMHFQAHQQNLTLLIRQSEIVELINHDLIDTLYDPVSHLLKVLTDAEQNHTENFQEQLASLYEFQYTLARYYSLNMHGQLIVPDSIPRGFTVLSYYLRFLHNLGEFASYHRFYTGKDDFYAQVYRHLNEDGFSAHHDTGNGTEHAVDSAFFFHSLDRVHRNFQKTQLDGLKSSIQKMNLRRLSVDALMSVIHNSRTVASFGFPPHIRDIQTEKISAVCDLYLGRVFFISYDGQPCLVVCYQGMH